MKLKKTWIWTKKESSFYSKQIIGSCLHVCCGQSLLGDVRIDRFTKADIKADYRHLPIRSNSFETVICDPAWAKRESVHLGLGWLYELRRVAIKRIIIIHHHALKLKAWVLSKAWLVNTKNSFFWKHCLVYDNLYEREICSY